MVLRPAIFFCCHHQPAPFSARHSSPSAPLRPALLHWFSGVPLRAGAREENNPTSSRPLVCVCVCVCASLMLGLFTTLQQPHSCPPPPPSPTAVYITSSTTHSCLPYPSMTHLLYPAALPPWPLLPLLPLSPVGALQPANG
ncbi:unnamed protein product [Arctogadus glacialis]